jgi:hypothetical protein
MNTVHQSPIANDRNDIPASLNGQMIPEVVAAKVEPVHADFTIRHFKSLSGRVWVRGEEPDALALIKCYHYERSIMAGEAISASQFKVVSVLDIVRHTMDRSIDKLMDNRQVIVLRVQDGKYPATVSEMVLDALRLRHCEAPKATTWLVSETEKPKGMADSDGWPALSAYMATFTPAQAPRGSGPRAVKSLKTVSWKISREASRCTVCALEVPKDSKFAWANSVGISTIPKQMVCEPCVQVHQQSSK